MILPQSSTSNLVEDTFKQFNKGIEEQINSIEGIDIHYSENKDDNKDDNKEYEVTITSKLTDYERKKNLLYEYIIDFEGTVKDEIKELSIYENKASYKLELLKLITNKTEKLGKAVNGLHHIGAYKTDVDLRFESYQQFEEFLNSLNVKTIIQENVKPIIQEEPPKARAAASPKTRPKGYLWQGTIKELEQFYNDLLGKFIAEQTEFKDFKAVFCYQKTKILPTDFKPIRWHNSTTKEVKFLLYEMRNNKLIEFKTDYLRMNACIVDFDGNTLNINKTTDIRKDRLPKKPEEPINKLKQIIEKYKEEET